MAFNSDIGIPTRFKKGHPGNPWGAQGKNYAWTQFKNLTRDQLQDMANLILWGSMENLRALERDPKASALVAAVSSVILKIYEKGDMQALDVLLNRMIGKVKDKVEITGVDGKQIVHITLPSNGREVIEEPKI